MDLKSGYWHLQLDEESSNLTTFTTQYGSYKWLCLPFGTNISAEIFAKRLQNCIYNGVIFVADDLMIYGIGDTDDEAAADYDTMFRNLLQRVLA